MAGDHADRLSLRPGPRDRRPGGEGGQRRPEVQGGRPRGGGLPGRLVPHLRRVPGRAGAVLRGPGDLHLQRAGQAPRRRDLRRLLREPRRRRGVRAARVGPPGPGRHGAAAVRRHHHLLAAAALERPQGAEGRRRGPRRAGAHGREVRQRLRRARRRVHDVARQGGGRGPAGRARGRGLEERRGDAEARGQLRLHPGHGLGRARPERLPRPAEAGRHADPGRRAGDAAAGAA